jgi:dolichyl-phosphate-mannose--protein O-mannosyl transferase
VKGTPKREILIRYTQYFQLAKLLIAFVAWISGFKGDFEFTEIGK